MPLPSSPNQITANQIRSEFGKKPGAGDWRISHYRRSVSISGKVWPLDDGIPTSGTIRFGDFHGKQHNIVIVLSGGQTNRDKILSDKTSIASTGYRNHGSGVRKSSKNKVYIIRTIGSVKNTSESNKRNRSALRTQGYNKWYGGQPSGGKVLIILGNGGKIYGAGGDGGKGGDEENAGKPGLNGNSALGIQVNVESVTVEVGGLLQAGGGGGGGGGGSKEVSAKKRRAGGGGGGGGAGLPAGSGGDRKYKKDQSEGKVGKDGAKNKGGAGGNGGNNDDECSGGGGGGGGSFAGGTVGSNTGPGAGGEGEARQNHEGEDGANGGAGDGGSGGNGQIYGGEGRGESDGGPGGSGGYAITREDGIVAPTLTGTTRIKGNIPTNPKGVT